jgi:hypothetical protein
MHAVLIEIDIDKNSESNSKYLRDQIAPMVQSLAGFRSGIWLNGNDDGKAMSITIWDKSDQADAMVARFGPDSAEAGGVVTRCTVNKVAASAFAYFQPGT